ncbi:MAG TPA: hypothetical protein VD903_11920 [Pseudonocardia sp.]|nr:hypothetical protein [Pseudonocardia sp.]
MAPRKPPRGAIRRAVEKSTPARERDPADAAAWALAQHYADLIDRAELAARYAAELLDAGAESLIDLETPARLQVQRLARLVEAQTVAAELGPKLLAVLQAQNLTTAARMKASTGGPTDDDPAEAELRRISAARPGARVDDPPPVDPATA